MTDMSSDELEDKIECYQSELNTIEDDISSCMMRSQTLDVERVHEGEMLTKLQERRKRTEQKIVKYQKMNKELI